MLCSALTPIPLPETTSDTACKTIQQERMKEVDMRVVCDVV